MVQTWGGGEVLHNGKGIKKLRPKNAGGLDWDCLVSLDGFIMFHLNISNKTSWWLSFNPSEKICASQVGSFPQVGMTIKNI